MIRSIVISLAAAALLAGCGGKVEDEPNPRLEILGGATALAFGPVGDELLVGAPRALDIRLTNQSSDSRDVRPLKNIAPGVEGAGLSVAHDCPVELDAGESCTLTVTAAPVVAGTLAGTFRLASNSDLSPQVYAITGNAVASLGQPAFAWGAAASGVFPETKVGDDHTLSIVVVNRGGASGTVRLAREAAVGSPFGQPQGCTGARDPGESCTVTVTFKPTEVGSFEAELELTDAYRDRYAPLRLRLTGRGVE